MRIIDRKHTKTLLALGAVTALLAVPGAPALGAGNGNSNSNSNSNSNDKQTICHATNSDTNQYVVNTPNKNGDVSGHAKHTGPVWTPSLKAQHIKWGDIIPPFTYNDHGAKKTYAGLNWSANGQAWFNNSCRVPITATVVKTNDANGDATFSDDETAKAVGAAVPFKVVVTNTSIVPAVVSSFVDKVGGTPVSITASPDIVGTTLAAGASATVTFTVAGYTPADSTSKVDVVTVVLHQVGNTGNGVTVTDSSTVRTFVPRDVSIVKTGPATAVAGDTLTWTLTVRNDSNGVPVSGVVVTDSLPAGTTLVSAGGTGWTTTGTTNLTFTKSSDLAVGATSTVTIVATLSTGFTGTSVSNTAVVTPVDATPADNTSTVTTTVLRPDVSIVKTGPATATPGDTLTWTLTVHNDGTIPARGVVVTDSLPAGTTLVSAGGTGWTTTGTTNLTFTKSSDLAVGATSTVTIVATLSTGFTGTSVSNTAVVTPVDVTPADNTSTLTTTVLRPDVSIVKTGPATAAPGDTLTWTLTVHNDGTIPAAGVVVADSLPAGTTLVSAGGTGWTSTGTTDLTFSLGSDLAVGATSTITIVVTLDPAYALPTVSNTAVVAPDDVTPADNTSTITTTVTTGGGGGVTPTPTPTTTTTPTTTASPFTGGGGGLPFTGLPLGFLVAGALALLLTGLGLQLLTPRGRHS